MSPSDRSWPIQHWTAWTERAFADPEFRAALAGLDHVVEFVCGAETLRVRLEAGGGAPDGEGAADIRIEAPEAGWREIFTDRPQPGWHAFTALTKANEEARVVGDPVRIAQALYALERLFELARPGAGRPGDGAARDYGAVSGHYADIEGPVGARARIYYETAGQGTPLVMLHTAGADSRQWLAQLADSELQRTWRMFAFDLPWHGRSFPPENWDWSAYRLTAHDYAAWCVAFFRDVVGEPPVVMGCSMGASMAVRLAALHAEDIRAIVGVETPAEGPPRLAEELRHAAVDSSAHSPSYVRGLMSPVSPLADRRRAWWIYSQGGLGVYAGDLWFYSKDYDGLALAPKIDTRRTPVVFLTGAYDYSASPGDTKRLAAAIPGAEFQEMSDLGHFPMTEAPDHFRQFLVPALDRLQGRLV